MANGFDCRAPMETTLVGDIQKGPRVIDRRRVEPLHKRERQTFHGHCRVMDVNRPQVPAYPMQSSTKDQPKINHRSPIYQIQRNIHTLKLCVNHDTANTAVAVSNRESPNASLRIATLNGPRLHTYTCIALQSQSHSHSHDVYGLQIQSSHQNAAQR